jgi:mannitol/fructose-specific phosphotransferase system IIA component (Ntr-type)
MTLSDFTSPGLIVPHLDGRDVPSILQELCHALHREKRVPDMLPFYHAVLNREFLVSTDVEFGMAFPHARLASLNELSFALGRSAQPVPWGARSGHPVRLVFLLAVPATDSTQFLQVISGLARFAKEMRLVQQIHAAQDTFQILEVLRQAPLRSRPNTDSTKRVTTP